jgi:H+/gluconate symporter-like permease
VPQWFTAGPDSSVEVVVSEHGSERMAVTDAVALGTMAATATAGPCPGPLWVSVVCGSYLGWSVLLGRVAVGVVVFFSFTPLYRPTILMTPALGLGPRS